MTFGAPSHGEQKAEHDQHNPSRLQAWPPLSFEALPPSFTHNDKVRVCDLHAKSYHVDLNKGNI